MCSVEKIVISGGVLNRKILYGKIQVRLRFFFAVSRCIPPPPPCLFVCVIVHIVIDCGRDGRVLLFFLHQPDLKLQAKTLEILKGYIVHELLTPAKIDQYITPSEWCVFLHRLYVIIHTQAPSVFFLSLRTPRRPPCHLLHTSNTHSIPNTTRGDNAGIVGALTLAKVALDKKGSSSLFGRARGFLAAHAPALLVGSLVGALAAVSVVSKRKGL